MRRTFTLALVLAVGVMTLLPTLALGLPTPRRASATLVNPAGEVVGVANFLELPIGKVVVIVHADGMTPGKHGIHIHTTGACSPDFAAAGGHFNPTGSLHGSHSGDLGNISTNPAGKTMKVTFSSQFTLSPGDRSLFDADGSALVIHAGQDDLVTDPAGNSGARIACGVIQSVTRSS